MADLVKGMRDWLAYSTMDDDEWDALRRVRVEQELRRLFGACPEEIVEVRDSSEVGEIPVPVRSGAFRRVRTLPGKVFVSKDEYEDGEEFKVHLMVPVESHDELSSWEPVCTWTFGSMSEVEDFSVPSSSDSAS